MDFYALVPINYPSRGIAFPFFWRQGLFLSHKHVCLVLKWLSLRWPTAVHPQLRPWMDRELFILLLLVGFWSKQDRYMENLHPWIYAVAAVIWMTMWCGVLTLWLKYHMENFMLDIMGVQMLR